MTLLRAGEAPRSDGEAMSTGSELSEEGSDGVFSAASSSSVPPSPIVSSSAGSDVVYTYDPNVSQILELHRALAQTYSTGSKQPQNANHVTSGQLTQSMNGMVGRAASTTRHLPQGRTVRAMSADFGYLINCQNQYQHQSPQYHCWGQQGGDMEPPTTPTSPTPSTDGSTASTSGSTPSGTPRSKNHKVNLTTISENMGLLMRRGSAGNTLPIGGFRPRTRSHSSSLPAHAAALLIRDSEEEEGDSDDDDDDYGFLSHYSGLFASTTPQDSNGHNNNNGHVSSSNSGMHKSKSPAAPRRLLPKRWRKPKWTPSKEPSVPWTPEGSCTWTSGSGRRVTLTPTSLVSLCNVERLALQKISLAKLQAMELGCGITIPKDGSSNKRSKRSTFSLKRKTNSESSSGWVFGIPLAKVTANDLELRRRKPSSLRERRESLDLAQRHTRKSSSSSTGAMSSDSLSETDSRSTGGAGSTQGSLQGSNLIDALSLSSSAKLESSWREQRESLAPHTPVVPFVVNVCRKHLETYGLNVLGIFRIGSSKKRIKQLREEFDCGRDVKLTEDHNPHDVGALLKVFFRLLPDPLLTRDLYNAFLATRKIEDEWRRVVALSLLVSLLPTVNRDTLWALLSFLSLVVQHSYDTVDADGNQVPGNKMDSHNLATLFGPNIMHKAKGGEFEVTTAEHAEERHDIIAVVQEMIDQYARLFEVPAELHDEVLRLLMETNPESADYILRRKCALSGVDVDPETSSSFYEENDNSSLPCSQSYPSENNTGRSRSMVDGSPAKGDNASANNSTGSHDPRTRASRSLSRSHRAEPPPQLDMLKIPQFRISSPEQGWYRPDSRSPSPMSPRISPSPKAMKSATPDLRIRILPDSPRERASSTNALITPRPVRFNPRHLSLNATIPTSTSAPSTSSSHTLTVPCGYMGLKRDRDSDSSSSLSSYYQSNSRSATNSPITPDAPHHVWAMDTPPASPRTPQTGTANEQSSSLEARTSSRQRPLGLGLRVSSRPSTLSEDKHSSHRNPDFQKERWKRWEMLAKTRAEELQEQETLV